MSNLILWISILLVATVWCEGNSTLPQQVIVALTGKHGEMIVSWVTFAPAQSICQWGTVQSHLNRKAFGTMTKFVDPAPAHIVRYIHTATLTGLKDDTLYYYQVGDPNNQWSSVLSFKTIPNGGDVVNMIVYGDFGLVNARSLSLIQKEVQSGNVDMVLHIGDFAYDLFTDNGKVGDAFLNMVQPITSSLPYMGCVGNHEMKYNGTHFTERFRLYDEAGVNSGTGNNWFYSWDYISGGALVHMVAITTEVYYVYVDNEKPPNLMPQMKAQYKWLQQDLEAARKRGVDWIIMHGHRPMYCSDVDDMPDCSSDTETLRKGINGSVCGMEAILKEYGVDLYLCGHEHSYERLFPVFDGDVDYQNNHTYTNPRYPVHIITGAAGNQEDLDWFDDVFYGKWSAVRSSSYGIGQLQVFNSTHLYWEQVLHEVVEDKDCLWIVKDK